MAFPANFNDRVRRFSEEQARSGPKFAFRLHFSVLPNN